MKALRLLPFALFAVVAVSPAARAGGTIDATEYVPVGAFNAWEMIDKFLWADGAGIKDESQVISVLKTTVVDGVTRYNVRTKFFQNVQDIIFVYGIDQGVVYLYGLRIIDPAADLGDDDITVPTVFFTPPVPCGDTTTALDQEFATTPITSTIDVSVDVGPKTISGKVFVAGTVTTAWNSVAPITTPLGVLGGGADPLVELQINVDFTYSSDDEDINDALEDEHTVKGVSSVMGAGIGFVQIDGQGTLQKIVNRVILPGDLVSNPADPDAFPDVPPGDLATFSMDTPDIVSLDNAASSLADGGITNGIVTLDDIKLEHTLGGLLVLTCQASATGAGPVELILTGKAKISAKTGGLKVTLKGKTKKLDAFAKKVSFTVAQELPTPFDGLTPLDIVYNAGKDPITKELITGTLQLPVTPFVGNHVDVVVNLPVDIPKVKNALLTIGTSKRPLGAEGILTLSSEADGGAMTFPVILKESASIKEAFPVVRKYSVLQSGTTPKLFKGIGSSNNPVDYALAKITGKLVGVKIAPAIEDVDFTSQ